MVDLNILIKNYLYQEKKIRNKKLKNYFIQFFLKITKLSNLK